MDTNLQMAEQISSNCNTNTLLFIILELNFNRWTDEWHHLGATEAT